MTSAAEPSRRASARRSLATAFTGVRGRLLALVLAALLPAVGLTIYRAFEDRRAATAQAEADALATAESAARTQARLIDEGQQLLVALTQIPDVRAADRATCPRLLARIAAEFSAYANLGVADAQGNVACSAVPAPAPVNVADRTYFQRAVSRRGFAVGDYQIGRITGRASLVVAAPVVEQGRIQGVVFAALDLGWLSRLASDGRLPAGSVVTVLDSVGTILARNPDAERWVGRTLPEAEIAEAVRSRRTGVVSARGIDGVPRLYGVVPLPAAGGKSDVFVTVGVSREASLADAAWTLTRDLLVLGLVGLGALGLAMAGAHVFLVRPIDALATAARCVESGARRARTGIRRAPRELQELAETFDDMAASLQHREEALQKLNDDLERRVAERTTELESVNEELSRQVTINRTVLDATAEAIALTDVEGNMLVANAATGRLLELLGVEPGAGPHDLLEQASRGTTDPERFAAELRANRADPEREAVFEYELAGGDRWFQRYSGPVRDESGEIVARIYTTREVTAERMADRLKSDLVATVSHELRTPLASILGFAELLSERELDEETRRRYLATISAEAKRLTALINEFLDLQRIEAGSFTPTLHALDLDDVLREQVDLFSAQSSSHELTLEIVSGPLGVVGDRERIAQVLANLLSNAIKYSPEGGLVQVRAEALEEFVRVTVTDEGLGIPAEQQEKLFTKFFRVDSSDTREIGGTGLGLSLAREIVHVHHGQMGFESVAGEGSSFWFELPAVRRGATGSGRILVVEDDPAAAALMAEYLGTNGYEVEVVAAGEDALERVAQDPPILVSLDIGLAGELDGWQVLTSLKAHPRTAGIPVIVCTARNGHRQAVALGAEEFLVKPFSGARLREIVSGLVPRGGAVVVADDDEAIRTLVREALAPDELAVRGAADGEEALALIRAERPDALVLDLVMPRLDGFSVLEEIQADPELYDLPVVVLTGKELSEEERNLLLSRAFTVLQKSKASAEELRRRVNAAVARASND